MPVSCFDCHWKILSDIYLVIPGAVDWQRFLYLESGNNRGRPLLHSRIALIRALLYMELSGIPSVSMLVRIFADDLYKTRILGFDRSPSERTFSRFKESVDTDRVMRILTGMIRNLGQDFMCVVGVDCTSLHEYSLTDIGVAWATTTSPRRCITGSH